MKVLFDCHVAKAAVEALKNRVPGLSPEHLARWREGAFLRATDAEILAICYEERRVFVTFDQKTIPDLLRLWAAEERPHSGVIFADENTIKPSNPSAVAAAVAALAEDIGTVDTENMVRFLRLVR